MHKHLNILASAALALTIGTPTWAQDQTEAEPLTADTVVAIVNDVEITLGHMIAARASLPEQYQQLEDNVLYDGILQQLVQQSALAQTYKDELPKRVTKSLENEMRSLTAAEVVENLLADTVTEEALQGLYDRQYGDIDPEEEFNASHILVETEEEAIAIKEDIANGASFAATAREKSTGPSGPNGGELGWFGAGMMVPSFEAAAIALAVGEVSDPVQTQFGWHVIMLNDIRKANIPTFEDVRNDLVQEIRQSVAQQTIEDVTNAANVQAPTGLEIDPAVLKQIDLLD
ncbi:Foldase protein PrsA [Roseobacter fucihabitans]|uniref:Parvulin-like PPIase n=1 Tax=Roseobacter fucihabitans TaxID=1537242 RepID=A0ABZ2BZ45_9RHOB|nr:peptidylprolyl isomerase [Roseobacter litoralis]MBC6963823.1 Foldase protein PrsA 1 precursor [Roseobacter litoralis]MBC6964092.1 Foldase protein PrsA 1 precursor [Roseobacter litoralis]